jgi:hypothetical protein
MNTTRQTDPNFEPANEIIAQLEGSRWPARLFIPSSDALAWDRPLECTNRVKYIEHLDVFCYCEVQITGRKPRTFPGGLFGLKARIRYTDDDLEPEDRGWIDAVLLR